jgi:ABC-2 type transport system ATP-binding protein
MQLPIILLKNLCSIEYYATKQEPNLPIEQVLKDISFSANPGELWSILGSSVYEIKLLLEIMANAKAYEKGKLMIAGFDTTKKKSIILPHVFYIGNTSMAYGNMNVLEYLMFITSNSNRNPVDRQEYLLNYLIASGMGYICLTPISMLTIQEKSIVILTAAIISDSELIILNLPKLHYSLKEINVIKRLTSRLPYLGKCLILSTQCYKLAQLISSHVCYIDKGRVLFNDTLNKFLEYDKVTFLIEAENLNYAMQSLKYALPQFEYEIENKTLKIITNTDSKQAGSLLFDALGSFKINPTIVLKNKKNIKNSIQGLMRHHDIQ